MFYILNNWTQVLPILILTRKYIGCTAYCAIIQKGIIIAINTNIALSAVCLVKCKLYKEIFKHLNWNHYNNLVYLPSVMMSRLLWKLHGLWPQKLNMYMVFKIIIKLGICISYYKYILRLLLFKIATNRSQVLCWLYPRLDHEQSIVLCVMFMLNLRSIISHFWDNQRFSSARTETYLHANNGVNKK